MENKDRIDILKQNILIGVSAWNGLGYPFSSATFVTKDGKYVSYHINTGYKRDILVEDYFVEYELSDKQMSKIYDFLEDTRGKEFDSFRSRDCSHNSTITIDGKTHFYMNDLDLYNSIKDLLGGMKNEKNR